jgi:HEAT repeat protein
MSGIDLAQAVTLVVFALNALLLACLIVLKETHRRRVDDHDRRRASYIGLISRHLAFENCTDPITPEMADDPAFLDALIDIRNAIDGPEAQTLMGIVDRYRVLHRHAERMSGRFFLGRRLRSAVALAELGDETVADVLIAHLDDPEPEIRIQAARGLGRMQWTPAIDRIVERFGVESPVVRARMAETLVEFGDLATWPLIAYVRVNDGFETEGPVAAIRAIADIGDHQAVPPLIDLLGDVGNDEVRIATVESLGILGNPLALPVLHELAGSPDWRIRAKTVTALGEIGDPSSVSTLVKRLGDPEWWVRRNSASALARVEGGLPELYAALGGADRFSADAALEALVDAGELLAARDRAGDSLDTEQDRVLLAHVAGVAP